MKVAYIAHPISGDQKGNVDKILQIVRQINLFEKDVVPFAPYVADCMIMDDSNQAHRSRCIENDVELLKRGFVDEVRLYGDKVSSGMQAEVELAHEAGIPVVPMTPQTAAEYMKMFPEPVYED